MKTVTPAVVDPVRTSKNILFSSGNRVDFRPGWDCHGLPIELKVRQQATLGVIGQGAKGTDREDDPLRVRKEAREFAAATVEKQKTEFK